MQIGIDNVEQPMAATVLCQDTMSKEDFEAGYDIDAGSSGSVGSEYSRWDDNFEQPMAATVLCQDTMSKEDFEAVNNFDAWSTCSGSVSSGHSFSDDSLLEIEERIQEFSHVGATPALADMVFNTAEFKLALPRSRHLISDDGSVASEKNSVSAEFELSNRQKQSLATFAMRRSSSDQNIQKVSYAASAPTADGNATFETDNINQGTKPEDCLKNILEQQGITVPNYSEEFLADLMLEMDDENFAAYGRNISDAARSGDLDAVRAHLNSGKTLQCCNKFQESAMHLVCRRGNTELLRYMLEETDVSPCIRDDIGRTPLHELGWANIPNFEMVKLIIVPSPELLYVKDSRGFTPLSYVGRNNWEKWCEFLEANRDLLAPRRL
jgi:ankyrin repeat protein